MADDDVSAPDAEFKRPIISRREARAAGLNRYYLGVACKRGHISERYTEAASCIACANEAVQRFNKTKKRREYLSEYFLDPENRKRRTEADHRWKAKPESKKIRLERDRAAFQRPEVRERLRARAEVRRQDPVYRAYQKEAMRGYAKNRSKSDIDFRLRCRLRSRLADAIRSLSKKGSAIKLLGCPIEEARRYIEQQFQVGMSWENWGAGWNGVRQWHLDHKKPLSSFDLTDAAQLAEACHYTNLQPLWALDNIRKGARLL